MLHWSVTKPVRHSQKLIHSHTPHRKGSVLLGVFGHLDLPKARFQIHSGKEPGAYHRLHGLLHPGKGVCIFLGPAVSVCKSLCRTGDPHLFYVPKPPRCTTGIGTGRSRPHLASPVDVPVLPPPAVRAIRRNRSLKGSVSNNSMMCSAASVQPISFGSSEKML